jgi:hypothetical protein
MIKTEALSRLRPRTGYVVASEFSSSNIRYTESLRVLATFCRSCFELRIFRATAKEALAYLRFPDVVTLSCTALR